MSPKGRDERLVLLKRLLASDLNLEYGEDPNDMPVTGYLMENCEPVVSIFYASFGKLLEVRD